MGAVLNSTALAPLVARVNVEQAVKPPKIGPRCSKYVPDQLIVLDIRDVDTIAKVVEDKGAPSLKVSVFNYYREIWMHPVWIDRRAVLGAAQ